MVIGVGCDIVQTKRIAKAMEKEGFLKILTQKENDIFMSLHGNRQVEWLAGRFAAKEAIYKALNKQSYDVLSKVEILCDGDGSPVCTNQEFDIFISISHEADYAIAYATVLSKE